MAKNLKSAIVFQTMFLFMILWMALFHKRWDNFRYFMTRNYDPESIIYLTGFLILSALTLTSLGWWCDLYELIKEVKIKYWNIFFNRPQKVQTFILCLLSNLTYLQISKNAKKFFVDICKKVWLVSEFNFTLHGTSD